MRIYDVSREIKDSMLVYPGDLEVEYERTHTIENNGYNWSRLSGGTHIGTHIDAPLHFIENGASLDEFPFDLMVAEASVIETNADMLTRSVLEKLSPKSWRVVYFKTKNRSLWAKNTFQETFVSLTPDGAEFLVEKGTRMLGIDYLSIEAHEAHGYPVHKILLGKNIFIIEGMYLNDVPAGQYRSYCFPLKLAGGDGGPARIVLEEII